MPSISNAPQDASEPPTAAPAPAIDDVIATPLLKQRPVRDPDFRAENEALNRLAETLAVAPAFIGQRLVEAAHQLTSAHGSGLSLQETVDGERICRWVATAGDLDRCLNGTMPRDASPCSAVLDRNEAMLMRQPVHFYACLGQWDVRMHEVLLAPFRPNGEAVGVLWVVSRSEDRSFDAEDLRVLQSISKFAATALRTVRQVDRLLEANDKQARLLTVARRHEHLLEQWFDRAPGFLALLRGPQHMFERVNRAGYDLLGHRPLLGRPPREALPDICEQGFEELLDQVNRTTEPFVGHDIRITVQRQAGEAPVERFVDFICQPVFDDTGAVSGIYIQGHDVTARRLAIDSLREADRHKDEFLATLAHELRNPLSPIKVSVELLRRSATDDPQQRRSIEVIDRQTDQLSALVDDLMDEASVRSGKISLHCAPVSIQEIADRALEAARPVLDSRQHRLEVTLPDEPIIVQGDACRLTQVVMNLLNNAAKYTPNGGTVSLTAEVAEGRVLLRVTDTGIGIAPDLLPRIFDMFTQAPEAVPRARGGLGIGLALVRRLVDLHGGSVAAHSAGKGRGSEFTVSLPLCEGV